MTKVYFHDTAELGWQQTARELKLEKTNASADMIALMRLAFMVGIMYAGTHLKIISKITDEAENAIVEFESNKENGHG